MADLCDMTDESETPILEARLRGVQRQAAAIVPGVPGDCWYCGEVSQRLVNSACAPCRDKRKLP